MNYRNVVVAFYLFKDAKDKYVLALKAQDIPLNKDLIRRWLEVFVRNHPSIVSHWKAQVMAPITSYSAEHVWRTLLGNEKSIFFSSFPEAGEDDSKFITRFCPQAHD